MMHSFNRICVGRYYNGAALVPLRQSTAQQGHVSRLERPVSLACSSRTGARAAGVEENRELERKCAWSSNLLEKENVRNESRQMRSRLCTAGVWLVCLF